LRRLAWGWVHALLFRPTTIPLHRWRVWLLRLFGARLHSSCLVYPSVVIWAPWNLVMEEGACLGPRVNCYNMAPVMLGKRAIVSQGAHLCTGTHDYESDDFRLYSRPIRVGADAWVCADAFLSPGVTIANGAVIGARSVVTRDQPAWMVCAGNPCRPLKARRPPAYAEEH
jgi:putative colanic acid biosynthesis acetyltransferase WcaF